VYTASELISEAALRECSLSIVPRGSVILGMIGQGKTRGMSARLEIEACINQNLAAIVPRHGLDGRFLHLMLTAFYKPIRGGGRGGNQEALNCEIIATLRLPVPPLSEQVFTADYLERRLSGLHKVLQGAQREIALLREYRTRLIADVVTGKLDVRAAAQGLPEEGEGLEALDEGEVLSEGAEVEEGDLDAASEEVDT
ncbi:MAG: restriction endonuclease subunit S, partial [Anaerolineae bacterium]